MDAEERELFRRAERMLTDDDWSSINATIERKPDPLFGEAVEERYRTVCRLIVQPPSRPPPTPVEGHVTPNH
jgi:hemerythrin-like domain-containing protein